MEKKKRCLIVLIMMQLLIGSFTSAYAQVTIGSDVSPNSNALLDLNENGTSATKGLLLPRVALTSTVAAAPMSAHVNGMVVYNTATAGGVVAGVNQYVSPGLYYNNGTKWERLQLGATNWFYMPSVSIDTRTTGTNRTMNLYNLYYQQFNSPVKASVGAPTSVPYIPTADQLYYYVTDNDPAVFNIQSISAAGVMTYDVLATATDYSFINIVFVIK